MENIYIAQQLEHCNSLKIKTSIKGNISCGKKQNSLSQRSGSYSAVSWKENYFLFLESARISLAGEHFPEWDNWWTQLRANRTIWLPYIFSFNRKLPPYCTRKCICGSQHSRETNSRIYTSNRTLSRCCFIC